MDIANVVDSINFCNRKSKRKQLIACWEAEDERQDSKWGEIKTKLLREYMFLKYKYNRSTPDYNDLLMVEKICDYMFKEYGKGDDTYFKLHKWNRHIIYDVNKETYEHVEYFGDNPEDYDTDYWNLENQIDREERNKYEFRRANSLISSKDEYILITYCDLSSP